MWLAVAAAPALADTFYVAPAPSGNNSNPGTEAQPFATIHFAATQLDPGDTLYIRGGTYVERVTFNESGTTTAKIVVRGYPNETAIIDGNDQFPTGTYGGSPDPKFDALVIVRASDMELRDLWIRNSRGRGLQIAAISPARAHDVLVDNVKVSDTWDAGIHVLRSDRVTVQNCEVWDNARSNAPPGDGQAHGVSLHAVSSVDTTFRNCEVHEGYGENIADFLSEGTTIEDNISWDSHEVGIYLNNSQNATVQRNIVYSTNNTTFWRTATKPTPGIAVNNELVSGTQKFNTQHVIVNNFVYNAGAGFTVWDAGVQGSTYTNSTVAHNTFVSTRTGSAGAAYRGIDITSMSASGNVFKNNIVYQTAGTAAFGSSSVFSFSHNNWSSTVTGGFSNTNDVAPVDPQLDLGTGEHPSKEWMKLSSNSSPVIDEAQVLTGVPEDFFEVLRGSAPDIGAHEFAEEPAAEDSLLSSLKPAIASSQNGGGVAPSMAVDGNMSTKWMAAGGTQPFPHWWRVDLGQRYFLSELTAYWSNSSNSYKIEVSDDDVTYATVVDETGALVSGNTTDALNAVGRYVRVTVTNSSNAWPGAFEFEVYGRPILSLGESATASSQNGGSVAPPMAVDGNMTTKWMASGGTQPFPHWWRVDLGQSHSLAALRTYWSNPWNSYKVEVSGDGVNYTTVVDRTGSQVSGNTTDVLNAVGRYVRITVTNSSNAWPGAFEFEVY